ncbi:MAG TPA: F0F1 ATP synthase subunit A [Candidatus Omnitrophota bacterium]|nr:F0F1 ATP synthase subunit A [Candidatus Omnitrophota bacterium]HPT07304.1 F0F1 ATP synthase subunit A [Candidatus Omnitrophota bacterium]
MSEQVVTQPELPDIIVLLKEVFHHNHFFQQLYAWEYVVCALMAAVGISVLAYCATRKRSLIPGRLQSGFEIIVEMLDDLVSGVLGSRGRRYLPFVGTLFLYILFMNLMGLIPFFKSATASLSTTFALSLIVFFYVQYTAVKELGFLGYFDHLAGSPRGAMATTLIMPVFMFCLHLITELIRPVSLSMRLRGNIWGDELLLAVMSNFGIAGLPLLFFNFLMALLAAVVQAAVFMLLSTVYFALVMPHESEHETKTV